MYYVLLGFTFIGICKLLEEIVNISFCYELGRKVLDFTVNNM